MVIGGIDCCKVIGYIVVIWGGGGGVSDFCFYF